MSFDLTNKNISDTFQNVLQRTGSDNRLYDLEGKEIGDLRISGSLYAQQYVVTSSVTNITTQQLSGSTQFGDSNDDTHLFIGNKLTVSASDPYNPKLTISKTGGVYDSGVVAFEILHGGSHVLKYIPKCETGRFTDNEKEYYKVYFEDLEGFIGK